MAVTALFALKRPDAVLQVCAAYPDGGMPELAYGRALALFQRGRPEEATRTLKDAMQCLPLIAKELLKTTHRRPKSTMPGYITMGGADEAYEYWRHNGRLWGETEGAFSWVAETVRTVSQRRDRKQGNA